LVQLTYDGSIWVTSRRGGTARVGNFKPFEETLRQALDEQGTRAVRVMTYEGVSRADLVRVMEAARRAGATEYQVQTMPGMRRRGPDPVLTARADGTLLLETTPVTAASLENELRRLLAVRGSETLLLRGAWRSTVPGAANLMAIAKRAGARNVAILVDTR
jgi:biopolymer transport protein ExbD